MSDSNPQVPVSRPRRTVTFLLSAALVGGGAGAAWWLFRNKPRPQRGAPPKAIAPAVSVIQATAGQVHLIVKALGTVSSARQISLRPRVSGAIKAIAASFEPGSLVKAGEVLAQIDPDDYQNTVALREAALAKAKADLEIEMGQQTIALKELATVAAATGSKKNSRLARRAPQLEQARADVKTAEVNLRQARLDLERCQIRSPFNALVKSRSTAPGMQVSTGDTIAELACTDEYRVEASVPLEQMQALGIQSFAGLKARVRCAAGEREGVVLHDIASLDSATRMGRLLISVRDPLGTEGGATPLLLDNQCSVTIDGGLMAGVVKLPRKVLRSGPAIWVAVRGNGQATLEIRRADIAWSDDDWIYVRNIKAGELVVDSTLGGAIAGMSLSLPAALAGKPQAQPAGGQP